MTEKSGVFEGKPIATEVELARLFQGFQQDGVRGNPLDRALKVEANGGMTIKVSPGFAHVGGYWYEISDTAETRTLAVGGAQQRTDLVMLRADPAADKVSIEIVQVTGGVIPSPVRISGGKWELPLARVTVAAKATALAAANIADVREFCGAGVAPTLSRARPGAPALGQIAYEQDTKRWIGSHGGTDWQTLAEDTGWSNLEVAWPTVWQSAWALKGRRVNGVVYIEGALRRIGGPYSKGDDDGTLLTVLPRKLWPAFQHSPAVVCDHGGQGGYVVPGRLHVSPTTGEVKLQHVAADVPVGHYVYLSNTWIGA
ncbi:hypothetical protein ACIBF1_14940 [Spirillospora sp. NPDC050679]